MRIFVISLPNATERRNAMSEQMQKLGVSFEFFDAVDCRYGIPDLYKKHVNQQATFNRIGCIMSNSEYGCALSHAMLYKKIVHENIEHSIILEDDVILDINFTHMVQQQKLQKSNCNGVFLYHLFGKGVRFGKKPLIQGFQTVKLAKTPFSTAGYYVRLDLVQILYEESLPISTVADWPIDMVKYGVTAIVPRIVQHPSIDNSVLQKNRTSITKRFGLYGFKSWIKYKILKPFCYNVSSQVEGK